MRLRVVFGMVTMLLAAGCAGTLISTLPPDHPANPAAADAPLPSDSQTLAIDRNALPHAASDPAALKPEMGGTSHQMDGMVGMKHDMNGMHHDMGSMKHVAPATQPGENAALSAPRWTPTTRPATTTASVYTCKMHPEVISNAPGKCPKCGMKLVIKGAP